MRKIAFFVFLVAMAGSAAADDAVILQKHREFSPANVEIKAGDTLVFKNQDFVAHDAKTETGPESFDLKFQLPQEERRVVLTKPGVYDIVCDIHPQMKLEITVK